MQMKTSLVLNIFITVAIAMFDAGVILLIDSATWG